MREWTGRYASSDAGTPGRRYNVIVGVVKTSTCKRDSNIRLRTSLALGEIPQVARVRDPDRDRSCHDGSLCNPRQAYALVQLRAD